MKEESAMQNICKEQEISRGTVKPKSETLDKSEDQNNPNLEVGTLKNKQSKSRFNCDLCGKVFSSEHKLKNHFICVHEFED